MGDLAQKLGEYARFRPAVPAKLRELAIIVTARHWTAQYEWNAHRRAAAQAGLKEEIIKAIAESEASDGNAARRRGCLQFRQLNFSRPSNVSDATFKAVVDKFGEKGVVDIIGVMGYYQMVSMLLNVDRYPLPAGTEPELK